MGVKNIFKNFFGRKKEEVNEQNLSNEEIQKEDSQSIETETPEQKQQNLEKILSDPLQILYNTWQEELGKELLYRPICEYLKEKAYTIEDAEPFEWDMNVEKFFTQLETVSKKRVAQKERLHGKSQQGEEQTEEEGIDFEPVVYFSKNNTLALMVVLPPIGKGKDMEYELLKEFIKEKEIQNGVDEALLKKIGENKEYMKLFAVAKGQISQDGVDGEIIEHIPHENEISYTEDESGNMDFKEFDLFKKISKGDLICDIILPTEGQNGLGVKGNEIKAKKGKAAFVPKGKNTVVSEDGTQLLAGSDGYITFQNGLFKVTQALEIRGDVDLSVGNLDFNGDIIIRGDVQGGFRIKAEGNITVFGMVEDSYLYSDESIIIHKGMNGNQKGELHAKGNIHSTFLENATVYSGGDIIVNSLVSCKVYCDKSVFAETGLGVIIGGSIMAMQSVKARIIGTKAHRKTEITLGTLPHIANECEDLEKYMKEIEATLTSLDKNISYLKGINELSKQKEGVLRQSEEQFAAYTEKKEEVARQIEEIRNQMGLGEKAAIVCSIIYPPVKININGQVKNIEEIDRNVKIFLSKEDEIVVSYLS